MTKPGLSRILACLVDDLGYGDPGRALGAQIQKAGGVPWQKPREE